MISQRVRSLTIIRDSGNWDQNKGIGALLATAMVNIGGWDQSTIHIQPLPTGFVDQIAGVYSQALEEENADIVESINRIKSLVTEAGYDPSQSNLIDPSPGTFDGSGTTPAPGAVPGSEVAKLAYEAGFTNRDQLITMVAIAKAESTWTPDRTNNDSDGTTDYGLWQVNSVHLPPHANPDVLIGGNLVAVTVDNILDPTINAHMARGIFTGGGYTQWTTYNNKAYLSYIGDAEAAVNSFFQGTNITGSTAFGSLNTAQQVYPLSSSGNSKLTQGPGGTGTHKFDGQWEDCMAMDLICNIGTPVLAVEDGTIEDPIGILPSEAAAIGVPANTVVDTTTIAKTYSSQFGGMRIHLKGDAGQEFYYAHLSRIIVNVGDHVKVGQIIGYSGAANGVQHLHFAVNVPIGFAGAGMVLSYSTLPKVAGFVGTGGISTNPFGGSDPAGVNFWTQSLIPGGDPSYDPKASQTLTPAQVAQISARSSFLLQQVTTTDAKMSLLLQGKRALSNDIPLLDWVSELVESAGRVFSSGPEGDFYAFFPDYFGWFKDNTPYFHIRDIEIRDFTIQNSDVELKTHVYGTGPLISQLTVQPWDQTVSIVASVLEEAFPLWINVDEEDDDTFLQKGKRGASSSVTPGNFDPLLFLQRYGPRPHNETYANIRNPLILWIATWMKFCFLWSRRFVCNAEFTYLPELFPGGRVLIGDDGNVEMFVQSTTDTWDLTGGFHTTAELIAPSNLLGSPFSGGKNPNLNKDFWDTFPEGRSP